MSSEKTFDICICSTGEDALKAELIRDSILRYRLPKGTAPADPSLSYDRICLDASGAPLNEETCALQDASRYLLLLCSPSARASAAISDRLVRFREKNGRDKIIAVLLSGEPSEAFPPEFIETKQVQRILPDMSIVWETETIEPVASDLRAKDSREARQRLRYETVRIIATVLGLHPDELERRHERRRHRAIRTAALTLSCILALIAGIFLYFGLQAKREGDIYTRQTQIGTEVAERLTEELPAQFKDVPEAQKAIEAIIARAQDELLADTDSGAAAADPAAETGTEGEAK